MARYTICHDHQTEVSEFNSRTLLDLFFSDPSVVATERVEGSDLFKLVFPHPLAINERGGTVRELYCDGNSLHILEKNEMGTLEKAFDQNGEPATFTVVCSHMLTNPANNWVNEEYKRRIRDYFASLEATGFDMEASAAFKLIMSSRTGSDAPLKGKLFDISRKNLSDALAAATLFVMMDTVHPAFRGSKKKLSDALKKAAQGHLAWDKKSTFYLLAVNEPFHIPSPIGSPMRSIQLESRFYFVENIPPYRVCELLIHERALHEETDRTELCWCSGVIGNQSPFDLAKISLGPIRSGNGELTISSLFSAVCADPRLPQHQRAIIEKSGVCAAVISAEPESEDEEELFPVPHTALMTTIHKLLTSPKHIEGGKNKLIQKRIEDEVLAPNITSIIYSDRKDNGDQFKLKIPDIDKLFPRGVQNGSKVFDIIMRTIQQANMAETVRIPLNRFVGQGMYSDIDSARKGITNICEKLIRTISSGEVWGIEDGKRRKKAFAEAVVVSSYAISNSELIVSLSEIWRQQAPYFTVLPEFALELEDAGYTLLRYILERARQETTKVSRSQREFSIAMESVRVRLGLPSPDEVPRKISEKIREPIERAMEAIEGKQLEHGSVIVQIEEKHDRDPKTAREWLNGRLQVTVSQEVVEAFEDIRNAKQKAISRGKKKAPKALPQ